MATTLKLRRGTTAQHETFTGAAGEVTVDTDKDVVVVHDGSTAGGFPLLGATKPQVLSVNSSSNALRITQTGSGNALVVEDSANPDSTPFVIDATGTVVVGHTIPLASLYDVQSITTDGASYIAQRYSESTGGAFMRMDKSRGASIGTNAIVSSGDTIGTIQWRADDGTAFISAASISAEVDGTPGTNDMPGRLVFSTTADGGSTPTERLRIDSAGRLDMRSSLSQTGESSAGSISGTTLTIGGTVTGTFNVGDRIFGVGVDPNTIITALGTGTGGAGTYTINNSQTVASTLIRAIGGGINVFRFTDTDTAAGTSQPMGVIEWYGSDSSTPGAGVKAYIAGISESATPDTAIVFGTSDNVASTQAVERMRIDSAGNVGIGTSSPSCVLDVVGGIQTSRTAVTSPASTDGNVFSGTYTPTLTNTTNITASTSNTAYYTRVGNMVTVSGRVSIDPTATGSITLGVSLPIASDINNNCWGVCNNQQGDAISVTSDNTNDRANFVGVVADAGNRVYSFTFQYQVV